MFGFFNDLFDSASKAEKQAARESQRRQREYEERLRAEAAEARQARIDSIRVFTGELKHRYVVVDTLRGFGHYVAPLNEEYDPLEATRRAAYSLQEQAADVFADAIVHARFDILRYTQTSGQRVVPVYEVHAFGTAVRIVGPSPDLDGVRVDADDKGESTND